MRVDEFKEAVEIYADLLPPEYPVTVRIHGENVTVAYVAMDAEGITIYLED